MRNGKKWLTLSGALLVTCALSSCTMPRTVEALMGDERTMPEGAEFNASNPRPPVLNPINNGAYSSDSEDMQAPARSSRTRHVPAGNRESMNRAADRSSMEVASASGRRIPSENISILSGATPVDPVIAALDTQMAAPSTAVETSTPAAETALTNALSGSSSAPLKLVKPSTPMPAMADMASTEPAQPLSAPAVTEATEMPKQLVSDDWSKPQAVVATATEAPPAAVTQVQDAVAAETLAEAPQAVAVAQDTAPHTLKLVPPSMPKPEAQVAYTAPVEAAPAPVEAAVAATQETPAAEAVKPEPEKQVAAVAAPAQQETPDVIAANAEPAQPEASYPSLAAIPEAPVRTPATDIASEMHTLNAQRDATQVAGQALLSNPDSTVMTSPDTGELVANAAKAQPAEPATPEAAKSDSAFKKLMGNLFGADKKKAGDVAKATPEEVGTTVATNEGNDLTVPPSVALTAPTEAAPPQTMTTEELPVVNAAIPTPVEDPAAAIAAADKGQLPVPAEIAAPEAPAVTQDAKPVEAPVVADAVKLHPPTVAKTVLPEDAEKQLVDVIVPAADAAPLAATPAKVDYLPEPRYTVKRRLAPINEAY